MIITDFGKIAEAIRSMNLAYGGRNISPIVDLGSNAPDSYTGSFVEASIAKQEESLNVQTFLWAVHRWDDGESRVL